MLSNTERIELMRDRTKRARERVEKQLAVRKQEQLREEATEFCKTVQDWHVYLWTVRHSSDTQREWPFMLQESPGKQYAVESGSWWTRGGVSADEVYEALMLAEAQDQPKGHSSPVYTNSTDFNEDQRRKRRADSIAEAAAVLIIVAVGYAFLIA